MTVLFLAAGFFAPDLAGRLADFFGADFFAVDVLDFDPAEDFLAVEVFFAAGLRAAVDFLAAGFLAAAFLVVVFFAEDEVDFLAVDFLAEPAGFRVVDFWLVFVAGIEFLQKRLVGGIEYYQGKCNTNKRINNTTFFQQKYEKKIQRKQLALRPARTNAGHRETQ